MAFSVHYATVSRAVKAHEALDREANAAPQGDQTGLAQFSTTSLG